MIFALKSVKNDRYKNEPKSASFLALVLARPRPKTTRSATLDRVQRRLKGIRRVPPSAFLGAWCEAQGGSQAQRINPLRVVFEVVPSKRASLGSLLAEKIPKKCKIFAKICKNLHWIFKKLKSFLNLQK